jgi:hypothetical protein
MSNKVPIVVGVGVIVLLVLGGVAVFLMGSTWTERGTIGDSFGMTNALFSGLAFAGVVYAILLQRQELALQREELQLTRQELSKSAAAQQQTAETQRQLAQLNAYTALMTYKLSEMREALDHSRNPGASIESTSKWTDRYKAVRTECVRIEAYIENILFRVGGRLDNGSDKSPKEILDDAMKLCEKFNKSSVENEEG